MAKAKDKKPDLRAVPDPVVNTDGDEINIDKDVFFAKHEEWAKGEGDAASDAGARRQEMGEYQKETGVNAKALSHARQCLKMKKETQRLDYIRSMEILLPMLAEKVRKESSDEMDFDAPKTAAE